MTMRMGATPMSVMQIQAKDLKFAELIKFLKDRINTKAMKSMTLQELGLSVRVHNLLMRAGITSSEQILINWQKILAGGIEGIGALATKEIREAWEEKNLYPPLPYRTKL